jgi:2-succinyl-6-hydroxy-2,4-cyclohexadiene-1-carboxylate synthase
VTLHVEVRGAGPTLALIHGFTQTSAAWGPFADRLAEEHRLLLVDAPGHGRSAHDDCDLVEAGRLLAEVTDGADLLGYSMGGRIALHTAVDHPASVGRLVLIGATAGIDEADERAERQRADHALADGLERDGLEAFVDRWLSGPLFATLDEVAAARAERLANRSEGLASTLRRRGAGHQDPLWDRLGEIQAPTLLVVGETDAKFRAIGERIVAGIGSGAELHVVPGAGHAAHLERPAEVAHTVLEWLRRP